MPEYLIRHEQEVSTIRTWNIHVEAESPEEARKIVEAQWSGEKIKRDLVDNGDEATYEQCSAYAFAADDSEQACWDASEEALDALGSEGERPIWIMPEDS